ncbi:MAG: DUF397 domain-containing protein [Pseudonocardiaceae bacterium]
MDALLSAHDWDERYRTSELIWKAGPNQWVRQHMRDLPPGTALDLASGEGRNAVWLADRGWQVTAIDFSVVAMDKAKRLAAQHGQRSVEVAPTPDAVLVRDSKNRTGPALTVPTPAWHTLPHHPHPLTSRPFGSRRPGEFD